MSIPEDNIKTILADWLDALRRHDFDGIERRMAPDVFWQGIREGFVCEDRSEAMEMLRQQQREEHGVEALELVATEEKVVLGVRSTQLQEVGGVQLGGQIFQVFTLRECIIVRVDEYERRGEALTGGWPGDGTTETNEPNSQIKIFGKAGILRMTLSDGSYSWKFIAVDGVANGKVMDSGTDSCHGKPA